MSAVLINRSTVRDHAAVRDLVVAADSLSHYVCESDRQYRPSDLHKVARNLRAHAATCIAADEAARVSDAVLGHLLTGEWFALIVA